MRLRFWWKGSLEVLAAVVGASTLYCLIMGLQLSGQGIRSMMTLLPVYLMLFGAFMVVALNLSLYKFHLGIVLSLGSTRKEALTGLQIYRLIPAVLTSLLVLLLTLLPITEPVLKPLAMASICLGLFLLCSTAGSALGLVYLKWGKTGAVITAVLIIMLGAAGGFLAVMGINADSTGRFFALDFLPWLAPLTGAAAYGLLLIPEHRVVSRYQVKL